MPASSLDAVSSSILVELVPDAVNPTPLRSRGARVAALCMLLLIGAGTPSQAARIVVLQASDAPRLAKTLAALQKHAGTQLDVVPLAQTSAQSWASTLAKEPRPGVVIALGPLASDFLVRLPSGPPTVHCLAGADALRAGTLSLPSEVPEDAKASWLRRLVPSAKTVGVAFDAATNARRAEAVAAGLGAAGYSTLLAPVSHPSGIPAAIEQIVTRADVLLALPDPTVYTRESARGILLHAFRKRTPVVGHNDDWVRMGALFAVYWDYDEIGAACAQLALRELQGSRSSIAQPPPPKPRVSVNLRIATQLGLRWDADALRGVDIRHE